MDYTNLTAEKIAEIRGTASAIPKLVINEFDFERNEFEKLIDEIKKQIDKVCLELCEKTGCAPEDINKEIHSLLQEQLNKEIEKLILGD